MCPDQVPWSIRVKRSWETLSNASAMAEQVVMLVKYSKAMRYIQSGSGIDFHLPSERLCLFLCGLPAARILCLSSRNGQALRCERGSDVSHDAIRHWGLQFGPDYAHRLKPR